MMLLRHLFAIAVLPLMVTVLIPYWLLPARDPTYFAVPPSWGELAMVAVGYGLVALGLVLFVSSLFRFATVGKGTLAPWDPPREFVVAGPYRYVRNPMISGVILILLGEAGVIQTREQLGWALTFLVANAIMIPLVEEPQLRRRFGASYEEYCRHVGRLVPRLRPWTQGPD
jgi:protein-S-isoprenylcysteine O-methyltransferase Ste14